MLWVFDGGIVRVVLGKFHHRLVTQKRDTEANVK